MSASERPFSARDSVDEFARQTAGLALTKSDILARESLTFEEKVMERFDKIDDKLSTVDTRLTKVDGRITGVEKSMRLMVIAIACSLALGLGTFAILLALLL